MISNDLQALFEKIAKRIGDKSVFDQIDTTDDGLICRAKHVESDAFYQVNEAEGDHVWVGLYTPDRWLSESIEAELMHQGDKLEELLEEELYDQGYETQLPVEHFRDDQKRYVFRSPVTMPNEWAGESDEALNRLTQVLLAYETTFRSLGDMSPKDDVI